jgi:hypothetical protein
MRCFVLIALAWSGSAAADDLPAFDRVLHWQLEPALRMGPVRLDGQSVGFIGAAVDLGVRYDHLAIAIDLAEMEVTSTSSPLDTRGAVSSSGSDGTMDRIAAMLRYDALRTLDTDMVADAWIAAGVGRELFEWDSGGYLARTDVAISIGAVLGMHGSDWQRDQRRWWGGTGVALSIVYARRDDGLQPIACGGPCDVATRPSGYDRSIWVDWTFPFGK